MYKNTLKLVALVALSCFAILAFSSHAVNAQQIVRTVRGHIRITQTEAGLILTWDELPNTTEYIIDVYNENAPSEEYLSLENFLCLSSYDTMVIVPASYYEGMSLLRIEIVSQTDESPLVIKYLVFWNVAGYDASTPAGVGGYLEFFLLGAIGKAFRVSDTQIDFYEIIEGTTQGVLALRITQEEVDEALEEAGEATCVKASVNDRASVTVWADGNVTLSIGPDYETKIFHVLLEGGLGGSIIGHSTTYGPPAGAHCPN